MKCYLIRKVITTFQWHVNLNWISYVTYYFQSYILQLCRWSSPRGGGGVFLGIRGGAVSPGSPISDNRIVIFNKRFQTWRRHKFCYHYLDENANQTLSFLLAWNWNDKYVHVLTCLLNNLTAFQTKMGKVQTPFQTKTTQKPNQLPFGAANIREYTRGVHST